MLVQSKCKSESFLEKNRRFLYSDIYFLIIIFIGALGFILKQERLTITIFMLMLAHNLIITKDMLPNFLLLLFTGMVPLARYNEGGYFYPLKYVAGVIIIAFIIHLIIYPPKYKGGKFLVSTILVAVAVTFGGLFSPSYMKNFKMPAIYYVFTLGLGMVGIYMLFESYIEHDNDKIIEYFAKMMTALGIMGIIMVITNYAEYHDLIETNFGVFVNRFQFGNNLSNNLLLAMPFTFYLSIKSKTPIIYFIIGCCQYLAIVFSLSRGGMISATIMIPIIIGATFYYNKKNRKGYSAAMVIIAIAVTLTVYFTVRNLGIKMVGLLQISSDEARVNLYKLAWQNFLEYPVFGTGLGYKYPAYYFPKDWCIYWYHSTLFQILGSLGILGIFCYSYQYFVRLKTVFSSKNAFNIFVLLSFVGFEGYSLVNVGNFAPLPYVVIVIVMFIILDRSNQMNARLLTANCSK